MHSATPPLPVIGGHLPHSDKPGAKQGSSRRDGDTTEGALGPDTCSLTTLWSPGALEQASPLLPRGRGQALLNGTQKLILPTPQMCFLFTDPT